MIFSNKIYKIENGTNLSININNDEMFVFSYKKSHNLYCFSKYSNPFCSFLKEIDCDKIVILNNKYSCLFRNDYITIKEGVNDLYQ